MSEVKMTKKDTSNLLKPASAVADFLDTLLQESTEQIEIEKPVRHKSKLLLMPDLEVKPSLPEVEVEPVITQRESEAVVAEEQLQEEIETSVETSVGAPVKTTGSVEYTFPLQCLMFSVAGSQLAIPLINMGSVLTWGERLTRLPSSPDWFLGILQHRDLNVKVADTAKIIQIKPNGEQSLETQHILVFGDDNWAITCDELGDVIKLDEGDVKWSKQDNKSLSLGTIRKSLAILLSPDKILSLLNEHEVEKELH